MSSAVPPAAIARRRLAAQQLVTPALRTGAEVVAALAAVQAQDYFGAKWALAQRTAGELTHDAIERELDAGAIVRTHVLRPTWHFVAPRDLRWMLDLTAARVRASAASRWRQLGLDDAFFRRSNAAVAKALAGGRHLTREELVVELSRARIDAGAGERAGHLLMRAELDGVVCSGTRSGKQSTYALLDERIPPAPALARDEALAELARRYFTTRGPATLRDFAWWSGLTIADGRRAVGILGAALEGERIEGSDYWSAADAPPPPRRAGLVHLLPNYDELFIGFRDRGALLARVRRAAGPSWVPPLIAHVVAVDGQILGLWRRTMRTKWVEVTTTLDAPTSAAERAALDAARARHARYLGLPLHDA